jgi:4-aminobutyrate aminotransferase
MAEEHISPVWKRIFSLTIERGEGCYVYDTGGTRYLDFTSGIGVTSTGHCHPEVVEAVREQVGKLIHAQVNIYYHQPLIQLTNAMLGIVPDPSFDSFFFTNSGAEALESAIKLARHATGRPNIITFQGAFHGRTNLTMATDTGHHVYRAGYAPLASGVHIAPFPYAYRYGWDAEEASRFCLNELRHMLVSQTAPFETAAILVEPVQGEGGYIVPPESFLTGLRQICDENKILLIFDEVQSGFGRTGKFFACEHFNVVPDIIAVAKGIASGFPLAGIMAPKKLMEKWIPGSHGGTYGANAVSCAAAVATIGVLKDGAVENAARMGAILLSELKSMQVRHPVIGDVRGLGLMVGVEFTNPDGSAGSKISDAVKDHCLGDGMLLLQCGTYHQVIRWIPPLIVSEDQVRAGLTIFERAVEHAEQAILQKN